MATWQTCPLAWASSVVAVLRGGGHLRWSTFDDRRSTATTDSDSDSDSDIR